MAGAWRIFHSTCTCASLVLLALLVPSVCAQTCTGRFQILNDVGISSITVAQSYNNLLYLMDRRDLNNSKLIRNGTSYHAVEYDFNRNTFRPIKIASNTWCSAGGYMHDGTILNTAGSNSGGGPGLQACRTLRPCSQGVPVPPVSLTGGFVAPCNEFYENLSILSLNITRWYPTTQILPNRQFFVIGGSTGCDAVRCNVSSYEFVSPWVQRVGPRYDFPFLRRVFPNYLYPCVHLLPSDLLFIFANKNGTIFDYKRRREVLLVPDIPDGMSRSYPSTGSSVLLPLTANNWDKAEVLICGGNAEFALASTSAAKTCYRIDVSREAIDSRTLTWQGAENMQRGRVMGDMLFVLEGKVLIINGAQRGIAGFATGRIANLSPELYDPTKPFGSRLSGGMCNSTIVRGYHSSATLLPNGRVFLAGSNPWGGYFNSTDRPNQEFLSEYRVEAFTPPVLLTSTPRPLGLVFVGGRRFAHNTSVTVNFAFRPTATLRVPPSLSTIQVGIISNAFTTHSKSMGLRYLRPQVTSVDGVFPNYALTFISPPNKVLAPDGYYMLTIIYDGMPSGALWVRLLN